LDRTPENERPEDDATRRASAAAAAVVDDGGGGARARSPARRAARACRVPRAGRIFFFFPKSPGVPLRAYA